MSGDPADAPAPTGVFPSPGEDRDLLIDAARNAGVVAMRHWRQSPRTWDKAGDLGPVTEADLEIDSLLKAQLLAARPTYGWLSEETEDQPARLDAARTFVVDPIDGTRAFIDGQEGFSHSLAVVEHGQVIAAAVFLPARGVMYAASADGPATRDGQPIRPAATDRLDGARVLTSKASFAPGLWVGNQPPPIRREFRPSLAWRLCLAAEGRFDAALSLRGTWEWDVAAGVLIAERAGCVVTDMRGRPPVFNSARPIIDGLVVAPPALHAGLIDALAKDED